MRGGAFKGIDPARLRRYATADLAAASGISVRAINAAKTTGSVRRKTWHALLAAMRSCTPLPNGMAPPQKRDKLGRFAR